MINSFSSNEISSETLRPSQKFNKDAIVFPRITGRLLSKFDQNAKNHEKEPRNGTFSMLNGKFNYNEQRCQTSLIKDALSDEQEKVGCYTSTSISSPCSYKSIEPRSTRKDSRRSRIEAKECTPRKQIDETHLNVEIMKEKVGFGFTIAGRKTTKGKLILCVGWVNPEGPAFGLLRAGDQIIKVNKETIAEMEHNEVVDKLKSVSIGSFATLEINRIVPDEKSFPSSGKVTIDSPDTSYSSEKDYQPIIKPFDRNSNARQSKKSFVRPTGSPTPLKPSYRKNPRINQNMMKFCENGTGNRSAKALAEARMRSHSVHSPKKHLNLSQKLSRKQPEVATNRQSSNNYDPNYLKQRSKSYDTLAMTADRDFDSKTRQVKRTVTVKRHSPERKMRSSTFNRSQNPSTLPRFYQMEQLKQPKVPSHLKNRSFGDFQDERLNFSAGQGQHDYLQSRYNEEMLYRSSTLSHFPKSPRLPLFDLSRLLNISPNAPSYYPFVERNIRPSYYFDHGHHFSNF